MTPWVLPRFLIGFLFVAGKAEPMFDHSLYAMLFPPQLYFGELSNIPPLNQP